MKSILNGVLCTICLLLCGTVSADTDGSTNRSANRSANNFWVLGSYHKQSSANDRAAFLASTLGVPIQQQSAEVSGLTHHRLLVSEMNLNAEGDQRLVKLGITPWLITLKTLSPQIVSSQASSSQASSSQAIASQAPLAPSSEYQLILVGVFDHVDEALGLERKIARAGLPIHGEAKLVGGNVMHQFG